MYVCIIVSTDIEDTNMDVANTSADAVNANAAACLGKRSSYSSMTESINSTSSVGMYVYSMYVTMYTYTLVYT